MNKLTSDHLHAFIMAFMINNDMKELIIRPPNNPTETKLYLHIYSSSDEIGNFVKIMLYSDCEHNKHN
jgi:hypothetical protein